MFCSNNVYIQEVYYIKLTTLLWGCETTIGLPESDVSLMWTCSGMSPVLNIRRLAQRLNVTQMF